MLKSGTDKQLLKLYVSLYFFLLFCGGDSDAARESEKEETKKEG